MNTKMLAFAAGTGVVAVGVFFFCYLHQNATQYFPTPWISEQMNLPTSGVTNSNVPSVWYPSVFGDTKPIRLVPSADGTTTIYAVGLIKTGPYSGKTLAAFFWPSTYGYFISDASGTPLAWDPSLIYTCGLGSCSYPIDGTFDDFLGIGFTPVLEKSLTEIPVEYHNCGYGSNCTGLISVKKQAHFIWSDSNFDLATTTLSSSTQVDTTLDGLPILRTLRQYPSGLQYPGFYDYFIQLPFGALITAELTPDFLSNAVPVITWLTGSTTVAEYHPATISDTCVPFSELADSSVPVLQTGTGSGGELVYEFNPQKDSAIYDCLAQQSQGMAYYSGVSYPRTQIEAVHPVFLWKSPYGEWVAYIRTDIAPDAHD